jgi:hypothetical protein
MQEVLNSEAINVFKAWQSDWCKFAKDVLKVNLDPEQQAILRDVQNCRRVSVCSGTARGKDFIAAVACVCFMYLTPKFNDAGELVGNTKIAMTAPTDRQVGNIMFPEVSRLVRRAKVLPGRLVGYDIRTDWEEWFLTGFKASKDNHEAWSGFHAANTMFVVTEASGIDQSIFDAIEGNLQGNSRLLIVFNPNITTGYAAQSQKQPRWKKHRLDSLSSPNVVNKQEIIPGQVDYEWVKDKVENWCTPISRDNFTKGEGDFEFEGQFYRPNDLFRVKVRGMFPKVSADTLISLHWIEIAQENWRNAKQLKSDTPLRIGQDVAGMGRDNSIACHRYNNYVEKFEIVGQAGKADHMLVAGYLANLLRYRTNKAFIDTIGEGAGVYSRLIELGHTNAFSAKFSEGATDLNDVTGVYRFANMRAYCFWAVRDWLNPVNENNPCLPPCDQLTEELTEIKWKFRSDGSIIVEPKEDIKKRLKRSPDYSDALAETFYPHDDISESQDLGGVFF